MYCDLDIIDIVADNYRFQTDHRPRAEIEAAPELSTLFALTRMLNARRSPPISAWVTVYVACDVPAFLQAAIAAAGGLIEHPDTQVRYRPARPTEPASTIADRAFRSLAERVCSEMQTMDFLVALRVLEAETVASPPKLDEDRSDNEDETAKLHYWTRFCQLCALTGEILRARYGGAWIEFDGPTEIPFGFLLHEQLVLPAHGAHRFLHSGPPESMFGVLEHVQDVLAAAPSGSS